MPELLEGWEWCEIDGFVAAAKRTGTGREWSVSVCEETGYLVIAERQGPKGTRDERSAPSEVCLAVLARAAKRSQEEQG